MEKYLVLATFVGSIIALLFVVITAKKVLRFSEGTPPVSYTHLSSPASFSSASAMTRSAGRPPACAPTFR